MKKIPLLVGCAVILAWGGVAQADLITGFEAPDYSGSPGGVLLTGQQSWAMPAGSAPFSVYTHVGDTYNVADNPTGGDQFIGGQMAGSALFARAQHSVDWSTRDVWTIGFDVAALYTGTLPAVDNLGSTSMQPSATAKYTQTLMRWMDIQTATAWQAGYVTFEDPATAPWTPGPEWLNLQANHWYRQWTTFRFSDSLILSVSIQDVTTGITTTVDNPGKHLLNQAGPLPTDFRFFTGGGSGTSPPGNFTAWDNLAITPEPASLGLLVLGLGLIVRRR
jgi:hypothetical protein